MTSHRLLPTALQNVIVINSPIRNYYTHSDDNVKPTYDRIPVNYSLVINCQLCKVIIYGKELYFKTYKLLISHQYYHIKVLFRLYNIIYL